MKSKISTGIVSLTGVIVLIACLSGCKDMFKDPLADKKTGDKITVLLIDRNFIKLKMTIRLQDNTTHNAIDQEEVEVRFIGADASNLITFAGNKRTSFNTSSGYVEVGCDPNFVITDQNPLELTVIAISPNYISAPQFVSYTAEGIKNLTISMIHKTMFKSTNAGAFSEPFDISYSGVLHSPLLSFMGDISSFTTGLAYEYLNMYSTLANGTLLCNNLNDNIIYSDYGAYIFGASNLVPPALPTKNVGLQSGDLVYSTVLRSGLAKCNQGLTIHVERADGNPGSGVFGYVITFSDGQTKSGQVTCTFPSDNLIEQIYYPVSNSAVSVVLTGDSQYDISAAVNLASPCGARVDFLATPKSNLKTYKLITQYSCPNNPVGMGISIMGEFRKTGATGSWTSFEFIEGICELQLESGAEYDFRVNIDSEYHDFSLPTDPTEVEAYLIAHQSADYTLKNLSIITTETKVTITAAVEFSQGVCDIL